MRKWMRGFYDGVSVSIILASAFALWMMGKIMEGIAELRKEKEQPIRYHKYQTRKEV